jgi:hypothetical protein
LSLVTEHTGGDVGWGCQLIVMLAGAPDPDPLTPATVYTTAPEFALVAWHVDVLLVQPVHT